MSVAYHLSSRTFACLTGRYCMFLDLKRDSYFSVPRGEMEELAPWIHGWRLTACSAATPDSRPSEAAAALAAQLQAAGVLMDGPSENAAPAHEVPAATHDLDYAAPADDNADQTCPLRLVTAALLYADWALRTVPIARIVDAVRTHKRGHPTACSADCNRVCRLTAAFREYRPFYPRNYLCLFDSLALIRFLSRFDQYPDWVFGVQDDPFSAHCWVQFGTLVLNDRLDRVSSYTPIMTV